MAIAIASLKKQKNVKKDKENKNRTSTHLCVDESEFSKRKTWRLLLLQTSDLESPELDSLIQARPVPVTFYSGRGGVFNHL